MGQNSLLVWSLIFHLDSAGLDLSRPGHSWQTYWGHCLPQYPPGHDMTACVWTSLSLTRGSFSFSYIWQTIVLSQNNENHSPPCMGTVHTHSVSLKWKWFTCNVKRPPSSLDRRIKTTLANFKNTILMPFVKTDLFLRLRPTWEMTISPGRRSGDVSIIGS